MGTELIPNYFNSEKINNNNNEDISFTHHNPTDIHIDRLVSGNWLENSNLGRLCKAYRFSCTSQLGTVEQLQINYNEKCLL